MPSSQADNRKQRSQIAVDLSEQDSLIALAGLHAMPSMKNKVKRVLVHIRGSLWHAGDTSSSSSSSSSGLSNLAFSAGCSVDDSHALKPQILMRVFSILGSLSNLRSLTIELEDRSLPVEALVAVLEGAKRLKELHLNHLTLDDGSSSSISSSSDHSSASGQSLHKALRKHTSLEHVMLVHFRGAFAVQAFLTELPKVRSISLVGSAISTMGTLTASTLLTACQSPTLQSIRLDNVPDLQNEHVQTLADALSSPSSSSSLSSNLNEFHLISDNLGDMAGEAMAKLLQTTSFLKNVTLRLGGWSQCGSSMANVLRHNDTMTTLDVLLSARTQTLVNAKTVAMFHSLRNNTALKELKVGQSSSSAVAEKDDSNTDSNTATTSQELEAALDAKVMQSLEDTMERNHTLETVVLVDDGFYPIHLAPSVQSQLEHNRSGLSSLLDGHDEAYDAIYNRNNYHNDYVEAIIKAKDISLDAVFTALINNPMIVTSCQEERTMTHATAPVVKTFTSKSGSSRAGKLIRRTVFRMRKPMSWKPARAHQLC